MKEYEVCGTCSKLWVMENVSKFQSGIPKIRGNLGDPVMDGKKILKMNLKETGATIADCVELAQHKVQ
jgi:hypothetical protein